MNKESLMAVAVIIIISLIAGAIAGAGISYYLSNQEKSQDFLIKEFYEIENAVYVSPHSLRVKMSKNDSNFTLVDLRSPEEYAKEHIKGAINIPAYKDEETPDYNAERLISQFSELSKNKDLIVYCYSAPCMTGRKVGKILAENEIYVKHLGIGWNEWRYSWISWNHEYEWNITNVSDYIEIGNLTSGSYTTVCSSAGLGC